MSAPSREELIDTLYSLRNAQASRDMADAGYALDAHLDALYARLATLEAERDAAVKALAEAANAIDGPHLTEDDTIDLRAVADSLRAAIAAARGKGDA